MPQYKKRVLFVNEFSELNTGYAVYGKEILSRLHKSGKYELAELSCYCMPEDPRINDIPWKVFPVLPRQGNEQENQIYNSAPTNEFGQWKFEQTCLEFRPDIILSIRDFWMDASIDMSPFRRLYKTIMMPTVDGTPQLSEWISLYQNTDAVFAYNDWSLKVLQDEGGGLIKLKGSAPPSADQNAFKFITNKKQHKADMGINPDHFIIGMVSRNQRRKLYPDLADACDELLDQIPWQQRNNTFLYWHTAYPDLGWEIPLYLKNRGLGSKVYFTYICNNCKLYFSSFYKDVRSVCPRCRTGNVTFPNTHIGISREDLGKINGVFDVYVQYVTNEGFGIGQVESAFCGNPVFGTDYSAMEDVIRKLDGYPIKMKPFYECETGRKMALPYNDDFVHKMKAYMALPESLKNKKRFETYQNAVKHYSSWDNIAGKWMKEIDEMLVNPQGWFSHPRINPGLDRIPEGQECSDERFVAMAIQAYLGDPRLVNSHIGLRLYRDLLWGRTNDSQAGFIYNDMSHQGVRPKHAMMDRNKVVQILENMRQNFNAWELARWQTYGGKTL